MADGTGPEIVGVDELYGVMPADPATWPETDDPDEFRAALMEVTLQGRDIRVHWWHHA